MIDKKKVFRIVTITVVVATVIVAVYIMKNRLGLDDRLDFGAGAYYYADIPNYENIDADGCFTTTIPRWVHFVLFFVWGWLMYRLLKRIEKKN